MLRGLAPENPRRIFGAPSGRRILELGSDYPANAIQFAQRDAKIIVVDPRTEAIQHARQLCDESKQKVEYHVGDLADLAFLRVDYIDAVLAAGSLQSVEDLARVFRQAHRVMKPEAPIVIALHHPMDLITSDADNGALSVTHSAWDRAPYRDHADREMTPHGVSDVVNHLIRSNFHIDSILEPVIDPADEMSQQRRYQYVPRALIIRAKKQGI